MSDRRWLVRWALRGGGRRLVLVERDTPRGRTAGASAWQGGLLIAHAISTRSARPVYASVRREVEARDRSSR